MILCNIKIDITNHILVYLNYFLVSWSVGFSIRSLAIRCLSCTLYSLLTVTMTGGDANICTQWNMNPIEKSRCYAKSLTILFAVCVYGWHSHAICSTIHCVCLPSGAVQVWRRVLWSCGHHPFHCYQQSTWSLDAWHSVSSPGPPALCCNNQVLRRVWFLETAC